MSDQDSRIIPPGQFGSPFFEPSGSMRGPELSYEGVPSFFELGRRGGTDFSEQLAAFAAQFPRDHRFDRYQLVITDGPPPLLEEEGGEERLKSLLARASRLRIGFVSLPEGAEDHSAGDGMCCGCGGCDKQAL